MEPNPLFQFNMRDVYRVLFRHKWRSLALFTMTLAAAAGASILCPQAYVSEAQLLVNVGVESLNSDPTANRASAVSLQVARAEEIKSLLDLFRSRAIAEEVVEELGVEQILQRKARSTTALSVGMGRVKSQLSWLLPKGVSDTEKSVAKIRKMVTVTAESKSNVIRVSAEASSPELAQRIADTYVGVARRKHGEAHETKNSTEFLRTKLADVKRQLAAAGSKLRDVKNRVGVVSIEGRKRTLEEQIQQLQHSLVTAKSNRKAFWDKVTNLRDKSHQLPAPSVADETSSVTERGIDEMHAELYRLRVEARGLESRFTKQHHSYKGVMKQVKNAERDLAIQEMRFAHSSVSSLDSQIGAYRQELQQKQNDLQQLNKDEVGLKSLESETNVLRRRYEAYSADVANSQIIEDRRKQQITNINVFQKASRVETPVSPNPKVIFALGAVVAFFAALAVALGSEFLDGSFKTPEEAETELQLPVLEVIPHSRRPLMLH